MKHFSEVAELGNSTGRQVFDNTDAKPAIMFPPATTAQWEEQVNTNNQHKEYTDATNIAICRHTHMKYPIFSAANDLFVMLAFVVDKTPIFALDS